jgi:hypothetical protein
VDVVNLLFKVVDKVVRREGGERERGWRIKEEEKKENSSLGLRRKLEM